MKAKVLAIALLAAVLLVVDATSATKLRIIAAEEKAAEETPQTDKDTQAEPTAEKTTDDAKEVHKRGIFYNGGGLSAHAAHLHSSAGFWPKSYAAHYGYNVHLPPAIGTYAHAATPSFLKYHGAGFHYKPASFAAAATPAFGTTSFAAAPAFATAFSSAAVPHTHTHAVPHVHAAPTAAATPFVLRPGGAVVSSYNVNYPQQHYHKPSITVQSIQPVQPIQPPVLQHALPVQPEVAHVTPVQHYSPVQPIQPVQHIQPIQHYQPVQSVQPIENFHTIQNYQPVHHIQPVQPVQPVVQVQPVQHIQPLPHLHPLHHYFQTTFVEQPPQTAAVDPPAAPAFPFIPNFPSAPAFPAIPSFPTVPAIPSIPTLPTIPSIPAIPTTPTLPAVHAAQSPNPVFPAAIQPPHPQQPPSFFVGFPLQPAIGAQFPAGVLPLPGSSSPDSGSAVASPQIPTAPPAVAPAHPAPEPELPAVEPQPTQQPWKPVYYHPSSPSGATPSNLNRPSNTLLPPYGSSPVEGYLPPVPSTEHQQQQQQQQQLQTSANIFDNLRDAEIEHIFAQANFAAQEEHHNHQQQQQHYRHHQREYQHHY